MALSRIGMNRFVVVGRAGMDLYADPPGIRAEDAAAFTSALGGSAANIAAAITRLGGAASLVTSVSDDAVGRFTLNQLRIYGIAADHLRVATGAWRNSLAIVETRNDNCQSVIYRNGAADFQLAEDQVRSIGWSDYGALIVTGTCLAAEPSRTSTLLAIDLARRAGLPVIFDVDYRPYSWSDAGSARELNSKAAAVSDIVIGNDVEFAVMAGGDGLAYARHLAASTAAIVVYKMGEKGSVTMAGGTSFQTGIFDVKALKPTGAGDAFMGGFATSLAQRPDVRAAVLRGTAAAAIVVTRVGCAPAMPTAAELDEFITAHPPP